MSENNTMIEPTLIGEEIDTYLGECTAGHADSVGELGKQGSSETSELRSALPKQDKMDPRFETNSMAMQLNHKLGVTFTKEMLVKPLPVIKVVKEKIENKLVKTAEDAGTDYPIYEPTVVGTEEVDAYFRTGIVLALPTGYQWPDPNNHPEIGDVVIYPERGIAHFDLFKDSQLINPYNVVAFGPNTCKFGRNYTKDDVES